VILILYLYLKIKLKIIIMLNQKDIVAQNIKILSGKNVSVINNNDEDYIFSALTVEGGGAFKKGISIGIQDKMVSGLMIYDSENFYGYSDKYGLCLLSNHPEYNELLIPSSIFDKKEDRNVLQPSTKENSIHFQNLKETEKIENKSLNIDLHIKDSNNFYIKIPKNYSENKFILTFDITFIYDDDTIISNINLVIINDSGKPLFFKIINNNFYVDKDFSNEIEKNRINKINVEVITPEHFIVSKNIFRKL
jgi:hypothetical protein